MELLYPVLAAPFAILALRSWARWSRRGGFATLLLGTLLAAASIDATRMLLQLVEDTPGGGPTRAVLTVALIAAAILVLQAWRRLGAKPHESPSRSAN